MKLSSTASLSPYVTEWPSHIIRDERALDQGVVLQWIASTMSCSDKNSESGVTLFNKKLIIKIFAINYPIGNQWPSFLMTHM